MLIVTCPTAVFTAIRSSIYKTVNRWNISLCEYFTTFNLAIASSPAKKNIKSIKKDGGVTPRQYKE
jgi:hypothetical protein